MMALKDVRSWTWLAIAGAFFLLGSSAWAAPTLTIGSPSGQAGTQVDVPVTFNPGTDSVAGIQFDLTLPTSISTVTVSAGAAMTAAVKDVSTSFSNTTRVWRFVIFGLNQNVIGNGSLLTARVQIANSATLGSLSLPVSGVVYSGPSGQSIPAGTSTNGSVTVVPAAPSITSAGTAAGQVGVAFSYQITATNNPTTFGATGLPGGLTINASGLISGTPTSAGVSNVTLSASNAGGTGTKVLVLTINPATPVITSAASASGKTGTAFSFQITATNSPTSFGATGLPAGLLLNTATGLISGTPTTAGTANAAVTATNAGGTGTQTLVLNIVSACDANGDGATNAVDVQLMVNQVLDVTACTMDLDKSGSCNVVDLQRVVNAVLGGQCVVN